MSEEQGEPSDEYPAGYCFGGSALAGVLSGRWIRESDDGVSDDCLGVPRLDATGVLAGRNGGEEFSGRRPAGNCWGALPFTRASGVYCPDIDCTWVPAGVSPSERNFFDGGPSDCGSVSAMSAGRFPEDVS